MLDKLNNVRHITLTVEISGLEETFSRFQRIEKVFSQLISGLCG